MDSLNYYEYLIQHLSDLQELIRIPSVYDAESVSETAPFGIFSLRALKKMESLLLREGYDVREYGHKAVSGSFGKGSERIDIASHLDVVSVSSGWKKDPFSGEVDGEYLYGRGAQDMKTSAYLVYLACNLIRESGRDVNREIRLVYGSDEERTMEDMKYYYSCVTPPAFAFTPDGDFPLCIGEKGALMWTLDKKYTGRVLELQCGTQCNIVPDRAEALLERIDAEQIRQTVKAEGMDAEVREENGQIRLIVHGKSTHASRPSGGHSATSDLLKLIAALCGEEEFVSLSRAFADPYGSGANCAITTEEMGELTLNLGVLNLENGVLRGQIDCRYPLGITSSELTERMRKALPHFEVKLPYDDPPTWNAPDDPYIKALAEAYEEVRGEEATMFVSGGVSYSKVFGHCVSFGPVFPKEERLFHEKDERISLKSAAQALEIYHKAILKLLEV